MKNWITALFLVFGVHAFAVEFHCSSQDGQELELSFNESIQDGETSLNVFNLEFYRNGYRGFGILNLEKSSGMYFYDLSRLQNNQNTLSDLISDTLMLPRIFHSSYLVFEAVLNHEVQNYKKLNYEKKFNCLRILK